MRGLEPKRLTIAEITLVQAVIDWLNERKNSKGPGRAELSVDGNGTLVEFKPTSVIRVKR